MAMELVFLGSGTSAGVPMIGCDCPVCRSDDPRDQRSRPSVLVRYPEVASTSSERDGDGGPNVDSDQLPLRQVLIDAAPEMRLQVLREGIHRLDGLLITHSHADHIFGLDDLRRFNSVMDAAIDLYAEREVIERLRSMFSYIFESHKNVNKSFVATLIAHAVEPGRAWTLHGATWTPIRLLHGRLPIIGLRVEQEGRGGGRLAYCTDASSIPPESYPLLEGLDVLVIDALRYRHHPTHMTVDQALEVIDRVRPRRAYLTHIAHDICHADLEPRLPEGVHLAYDGLRVTVGEKAPTPTNG